MGAACARARRSPLPGTMVRYVDADGQPLGEAASKDTYTGFFYGVSQSMPYVHDAALRKALLADLEALGRNHFLDHDLVIRFSLWHVARFESLSGGPDLSPKPCRICGTNASLRHDRHQNAALARWYFWVHGERPPASFARLMQELKHPSSARFERELAAALK